MHLGLIGGIGPAATEFYYRGLVRAFATAGQMLDLTIVNADSGVMLKNLVAGDPQAQADVFAGFVRRLEAAGADVAVVTSLGGHFCIKELEAISPLPLINAIPVLDRHFCDLGLERVALMGTRMVMESKLYGGVTSVELIAPQGDELQRAHENYVAMAQAGEATPAQRAYFLDLGERLCGDEGADAVALAGTDLFLAYEGAAPDYRVIDCADVHIGAIAAAALGKGDPGA